MTYRIARNGGQFTVADKSGVEVAVHETKQEARQGVQLFKRDDAMSRTARRLVAVADAIGEPATVHPPLCPWEQQSATECSLF